MEKITSSRSILSLIQIFDKQSSNSISISNNNNSNFPKQNSLNFNSEKTTKRLNSPISKENHSYSTSTSFSNHPSSIAIRALNMEQNNKSSPIQKYSTFSSSLNSSVQNPYTFLTPVSISSNVFNPTFCEAFLIVSFPSENSEAIPKSSSFPISCNHFLCSKLPSMKPNVIFSYPENPPNVDINIILASMCFPEGIRVCYGNPSNHKEEPPQLQNIITCITNQNAERFYLTTSTFYFKISSDKYNTFSKHPASLYKDQVFKDISKNGAKLNNKDTEELNNINILFSQEFVYVPYCFALISKYPYIHQMKQCLISIKNIFDDNRFEINDIVDIIKHLISEIPIPIPETKLTFYMPFIYPIELLCPNSKDYLLLNQHIECIFNLKPEIIMTIFKLLLYEQRLVFIDDDLELVFNIINAFIMLIYPLQWVNPFIPIMTIETEKYMSSIVPFLYGMSNELYNKMIKTDEEDFKMKDSIYLVKISHNEIIHLLNGEKQTINIPSFSNDIEEMLENGIRDLHKRKHIDNIKNDIEIQTRFLFFKTLYLMFLDLPTYVNVLENNHIFNQSLFLENKPKSGEESYKIIFNTQNFQMFLQNTIQNKKAMFYYDIVDKTLTSNSLQILEEHFLHIFNKYKQIDKLSLYVIKPPFIDENLLSKNSSTPSLYENTVSLMYPYEDDKKIINRFITLNKVNYENISYFKYPDINILMDFTKKTSSVLSGKIKFFNVRENKNLKYKQLLEKRNNEGKLSEQDIKEIIKEVLSGIFLSKEISREISLLNDLLNVLETSFSKDYLVQILYQDGKHLSPKILSTESFSFLLSILSKLIGDFFNETTKSAKNIKNGIKLIIITKMYYTYLNENDKQFMFNYIKMSLKKFKNTLISEMFINEFIFINIENKNVKGLNKKERDDYNEKCKVDILYECLCFLKDIGFDCKEIYEITEKVIESKMLKLLGSKVKVIEEVKKILAIE